MDVLAEWTVSRSARVGRVECGAAIGFCIWPCWLIAVFMSENSNKVRADRILMFKSLGVEGNNGQTWR